MALKTVTVLGAMGRQGAGVVSGLLQDQGKYHIRAVTRRPESDAAKSLQARGVEIVQADMNDVESLKKLFEGSHIIYSVTDFFEPFATLGPGKALEIEARQGINVAKAAAATPSLEHFIWSTLPSSTTISDGKYFVPHFEGKNQVNDFIRKDKALLAKTTFLWVTWYHNNYDWPMFTPYPVHTSGKYVQFTTHSPDTEFTVIGDVRANIGPFVRAILAKPELTKNGAIVKGEIGKTTSAGILNTWAASQGKEAVTARIDIETYNALWPLWAEELGIMIRFWDAVGERSWTAPGHTVLTRADLGLTDDDFVPMARSLKELNKY